MPGTIIPPQTIKRSKKKPETTAAKLERNLVDARVLLAFLVRFAAAAQKAEARRKKKLLAKAIIDAFRAHIHVAATALNAQNTEKKRTAAASANEAELRARLHDRVARVRKLIQATYPTDRKIARAFGQGSRFVRTSTQDAIALSALQEQSFIDPEFASRARDAGLTPSDFSKQTDLRRSLEAADAAHTGAIGTRKGHRLDAEGLGAALTKQTTHLRKAADVVFADHPKVLAQLPKRRRHTPKTRKRNASAAPKGAGTSASGT